LASIETLAATCRSIVVQGIPKLTSYTVLAGIAKDVLRLVTDCEVISMTHIAPFDASSPEVERDMTVAAAEWAKAIKLHRSLKLLRCNPSLWLPVYALTGSTSL
jgi:hypothetical protein